MAQELAVFLINLDSSPDRLAVAQAALSGAGLTAQRVPAFDGRGVPLADLPLYDAAAALRGFGRVLVGGEVGCFISHRRAVQAFVDSGATYGLVLEDDITLPSDAGMVIQALIDRHRAEGGPWQIANLGKPASRVMTPLAPLADGRHRLMQAHYFPMTAHALIWTRPAAQHFLTQTANRIDMPVDNWIQNWASRAGCGVALNPPLITPAVTDSTIDARGRRNAAARGPAYFLAKQRRLWSNKLHALRNRAAVRRKQRLG